MTKVRRASVVSTILDEAALARAVSRLAKRDHDLARVVGEYGRPPLWEREPGFETLVLIILEQQVSLASAAATCGRLLAAAGEVTPARLAEMSDEEVRAAGITRQKSVYLRDLARLVVEGELDLRGLERMDDDAARAELTKVKGIGAWTAEIYLLRALGRADAWPAGDLAVQEAIRIGLGLKSRPTVKEMAVIGEAWRPYRGAAAHLFWAYYKVVKANGFDPMPPEKAKVASKSQATKAAKKKPAKGRAGNAR
jgi:DNA-3-methyladenine glycosylase II